jgi:D-beta-D-heptose 7-phosphate kinase/D-beta-D-heptose 1-phosphate adenosyltransferase
VSGSGNRPLVVVGDALLDRDLEGRAARLCPDAPVPVLDDLHERGRPGGAGLAAVLAAADGRDVVLVSAVGGDAAGARLRAALDGVIELVELPLDGGTPEKIRVRAAGQSVVRLDRGTGRAAHTGLPDHVAARLAQAGAVLVSDYGRGLTAHPELRRLLHEAASRCPVVWDPHPRGTRPVADVRVATPNANEAEGFAPLNTGGGALSRISARAVRLVAEWGAASVAVTMGARGALLSYGEGTPLVVPAMPVDARDTCGAGDRFSSAVAATLLDGALPSEAVTAAVTAATDFVRSGGAAAVGDLRPDRAPRPQPWDLLENVRAAGGTVVATGGCFDLLHAGHVSVLRAARALGDCLIVCLNSDASVRRLKGPGRPIVPEEDRARVLRALECVDAVAVFDEEDPRRLLAVLRPDVWAKGGDYTGDELPEAELIRGWGGQVVLLPYLPGRSTTRLVRGMKGAENE